jgi:hypothetical protein
VVNTSPDSTAESKESSASPLNMREQRQIIHDLSHFQGDTTRDLHRSQVGIFVAYSCDLLLVAAISEDLAFDL